MYADDSDESINKKANIDEFVNSIDEFCKLNKDALLSDFLNQVTLSSDTDEMDETEYVTLATIHSVKGLEFKVVFLAGLEENIMPVSRAAIDTNELEEERRLMYVATPAHATAVFHPFQSRYLYGRTLDDAAIAVYRRLSLSARRRRKAARLFGIFRIRLRGRGALLLRGLSRRRGGAAFLSVFQR